MAPIRHPAPILTYSSLFVLVAKLCLILCNPMDCSLPDSYVHGVLQARILEWVAISLSSIYIYIYTYAFGSREVESESQHPQYLPDVFS